MSDSTSNDWNKPSAPISQSEIEAYHRDSIEYLISNPDSGDWNVKDKNPMYLTKSEKQNMNDTADTADKLEDIVGDIPTDNKLYPRGEASLESIFCFGKHKGKQVEDMIEDQPGYITWLVSKEVISFDEETYQLLEEKGLI